MKKTLLIFLIFSLFFYVSLSGERVLIPKSEYLKLDNLTKKKMLRKSGKFFIMDLDKKDIEKLRDEGIEIIIEKKGLRKSSLPNDTFLSNQWWVQKVDLDSLWDYSSDCSKILVAVVDTGVDYNHIDLKDNIYVNPNEICGNGKDDDNNGFVDDCYGYDFANNDPYPMDDDADSHGTHVAGTIGAVGNNGIGIAGICWKAKILPVKVLDENGNGYFSDVADGIKYAVDMGAKVINLSLETNYIDDTGLALLEDAVKYAYEHGVFITSAAGNQSKNLDSNNVYPASFRKNYPNVIVTASIDRYGDLSSFTDYGYQTVDIGIPGENIYSTLKNNTYGYQTGSSMANAITTGLVAQILSIGNNDSFNYVRSKLIEMAKSTVIDIATISSGFPNFSKILDNVETPLIFTVKYPSDSNYIDVFGFNLDLAKFYINNEVVSSVYRSKYFAVIDKSGDTSIVINAENDYGKSNPLKINTIFSEAQCLDYEFINYLPDGWSMVGSNCDITDFNIFSRVYSLWIWDNGKWEAYSPKDELQELLKQYGLEPPNVILHKQGMWVYK